MYRDVIDHCFFVIVIIVMFQVLLIKKAGMIARVWYGTESIGVQGIGSSFGGVYG